MDGGGSISQAEWEEIVEKHYDEIYSYALHFFRSPEEAEDAVQDTFLKAHIALSSIKDRTKIRGWLYSIVRNVCIDRTRSLKRKIFGFLAPPKDVRMERGDDDSIAVRQLVKALPARQREVFILRHWHGFSTEETAKLLGISEGGVKANLFKAIATMKKKLSP